MFRGWKWRLWAICAALGRCGRSVLFDSLCEKVSGVGGSSLTFGFGGLPYRCFGGGCGGPCVDSGGVRRRILLQRVSWGTER